MSTPGIGKIAEPLVLGHLLQWALFGALSVQVYIYYLAFPNDPLHRKLLVYGTYAIELVQTILLARMAYLEFSGNYLILDTIPATYWFGVPILVSIAAAVVQIFYAYRIRLLTNCCVVPGVVLFLSLLQLGGGITLGAIAKETLFFSRLMDRKTVIVTGIWNGSSALCDVIITGYMTYVLSQRKSIWKQTQRRIHQLMCLILETGMLTAALAIMNFCFFLIPESRYYQTTSIILGEIYSNTMMVVLNSRMEIEQCDSVSMPAASPNNTSTSYGILVTQ